MICHSLKWKSYCLRTWYARHRSHGSWRRNLRYCSHVSLTVFHSTQDSYVIREVIHTVSNGNILLKQCACCNCFIFKYTSTVDSYPTFSRCRLLSDEVQTPTVIKRNKSEECTGIFQVRVCRRRQSEARREKYPVWLEGKCLYLRVCVSPVTFRPGWKGEWECVRAGTKLWFYTQSLLLLPALPAVRSGSATFWETSGDWGSDGSARRFEQVGDKKATKMIRRVRRSIQRAPPKFVEEYALSEICITGVLRERERERASPKPAEGGPIAHSKAKPPRGAWDVTPSRSAFISAATNQKSDRHDVRSSLSL